MLALVNGNFRFRPSGQAERFAGPCFMPLGLLALRSYTERHVDEEVRILSPPSLVCADGGRVEAVARFLDGVEARVLGISVTALSLPAVLLALRQRRRRDQHVVLGGAGTQGLPDRALNDFPEVDVLVRGEGEIPLVAALRHLDRSGEGIPGATYRDGDRIVRSHELARLRTLEGVPPVFQTDRGASNGPVRVLLESSRGCPFRCAFCSSPAVWGNRITYRSPTAIFGGLEELTERIGPVQAVFVDDLFTLSRKRVLELCALLRRAALPVQWACFGRVETVDERLLRAMGEAGCTALSLGIETGDDGALARLNKGFTVERARRAVAAATAAIPVVEASFIRGFPFETPHQYGKTVELMAELRDLGCHIKLYSLTPLLGTGLHTSFHHHWRWEPTYRNPSLQEWYPLDPDLLDLLSQYPYLAYPYGYYHDPGRREKERMTPEWAALEHTLAGARRSAGDEPDPGDRPDGRSTTCGMSPSTSATVGGA